MTTMHHQLVCDLKKQANTLIQNYLLRFKKWTMIYKQNNLRPISPEPQTDNVVLAEITIATAASDKANKDHVEFFFVQAF